MKIEALIGVLPQLIYDIFLFFIAVFGIIIVNRYKNHPLQFVKPVRIAFYLIIVNILLGRIQSFANSWFSEVFGQQSTLIYAIYMFIFSLTRMLVNVSSWAIVVFIFHRIFVKTKDAVIS